MTLDAAMALAVKPLYWLQLKTPPSCAVPDMFVEPPVGLHRSSVVTFPWSQQQTLVVLNRHMCCSAHAVRSSIRRCSLLHVTSPGDTICPCSMHACHQHRCRSLSSEHRQPNNVTGCGMPWSAAGTDTRLASTLQAPSQRSVSALAAGHGVRSKAGAYTPTSSLCRVSQRTCSLIV